MSTHNELTSIAPGAVAIRRLSLLGMLLCLTVIVLGAWVRLTDAGLGCPDWPGCYGHVTPAGAERVEGKIESFDPGWEYDSGKAWREMIHRYAATLLGFIIVVIAAIALAYRRERPVSIGFALGLLAVVLLQGMLGAFTVWWLVKPLVVVLHLAGGLTTLGLLTWMWLGVRRTTGVVNPSDTANDSSLKRARTAGVIALVVVAAQIMLGGWTSSNYAAVACPDLPQCQGEWWPDDMQFDEAFVLWRGLDINYTGGVLEHPARVAIHFTHRIGAIIATLAVLWAAWLAWRSASANDRVRRGAIGISTALALQLLIAILMILEAFPLWLATGHNAGAALLLLSLLVFNKRLRESSPT